MDARLHGTPKPGLRSCGSSFTTDGTARGRLAALASHESNPTKHVLGKLGKCTASLDGWNKKKKKMLSHQLVRLRKEMATVNERLAEFGWSYLRDLETKLDILLSEEEQFWQ
ncbi:hypothetical protein ACOSP7_011807 [Xanthoceras sorbifolium]